MEDSPVFQDKRPASAMYLTSGDLDEFVSYWAKVYKQEKSKVREIAETALEFTGGHFYPFVRIADDFFQREEWCAASARKYLESAAYLKSDAHLEIAKRCFSSFDHSVVIDKVRNLFLGISGDYHFLDDLGLWNETARCFYSPLALKHLFHRCSKLVDPKEMDETPLSLDEKKDRPQQVAMVIVAGFEYLNPACLDAPSNEDAIGFAWGMEAQRRVENLFLAPQVAVSPPDIPQRGRPPTVDFVLNGRLDTALELVRNGTASSLEEHFNRFNTTYAQWKNLAVLNLQMTGSELVHSRGNDKRLFTFVRETNALYWGSDIYKSNVMRRLATPSSRFHTFVRPLLRVWR